MAAPRTRDGPVLALGDFGPETHVSAALNHALQMEAPGPVTAGAILEAVAYLGRTSQSASFRYVTELLERLSPRDPELRGQPPEIPPSDYPISEGLDRSWQVALGFLEDRRIWGRDLVTWALLTTGDPTLDEVASMGGTDLPRLREEWCAYVTGDGQRRERADWVRWWREAGVEAPEWAEPAYLLTWNPAQWPFAELPKLVDAVRTDGSVHFSWRTGNRRSMAVGSRVFLLKQGEEGRGLIGEGRTTGEIRVGVSTSDGRSVNDVDVAWTFLSKSPVLDLAALESATGDDSIWATRSGGVELKPQVLRALLLLWKPILEDRPSPRPPDTPPPDIPPPLTPPPEAPSLFTADFDRKAYLQRLDDGASEVLSYAKGLADQMEATTLLLEHLVGGLIRTEGTALDEVLRAGDLTPDEIRREIRGPGESELPGIWRAAVLESLPLLSTDAFAALQLAETLADRRAGGRIRVQDLAEGILSVTANPVVRRLRELGLTRTDLPWHERDLPVRQSGFWADSPTGRDLLDMTDEARILAAVMAAKDVHPPLSIGLFGPWGSGKSFFMRLLQKEIITLEESDDDEFCRSVVQIRFNAWHYIDSNLWASLANEVFEQLGREIEARQRKTDGGEEATVRRARLLMAVQRSRSELEEVDQRRRELTEELARARKEAEEARDARWLFTSDEGAERVADATFRRFIQELDDRGDLDRILKPLGVAASDLSPRELRRHLQAWDHRGALIRGWWGALKDRSVGQVVTSALLLAVAVLVFGNPWGWLDGLLDRVNALVGNLVAGLAAVGAVVGPYAVKAKGLVDQLRPLAADYRKFDAGLRDVKDKLQEQLADEDKARVKLILDQMARAEAREAAVRQQLQETEDELRTLLTDDRIQEFVRRRRESRYYRDQLGIIAQARQDFDELSRIMEDTRTRQEEFLTERDKALEAELAEFRPDVPNIERIVLYIDDLDRCPEDKVVDVLQAVHLLLYFRLFVVVVGVDPRWLIHSLAERSDVFSEVNGSARSRDLGKEAGDTNRKRYWRSTPMDYLEKIFQIPLHLRPMGEQGFGQLVDALTRDPGRPETESAEGDTGTTEEGTSATAGGGADAGDGKAEPGDGRTAAGEEDGGGDVQGKDASPRTGDADAADTSGGAGSQGPGGGPTERSPDDGRRHADATAPGGGDRTTKTGEGGQATQTEEEDQRAGDAQRMEDTGEAGAEDSTTTAPHRPLPRPKLSIGGWERDFMHTLHPFIRSPRSAKRFVNVYRLVRSAQIEPPSLGVSSLRRDLEGGDADGGPAEAGIPEGDAHRQVMFLLAMLTGFPAPSIAIFQCIRRQNLTSTWGEFRKWLGGVVEGIAHDSGPAAGAQGTAPGGASEGQECIDVFEEIDREEWDAFLDALDRARASMVKGGIDFDPPVDQLNTWTLEVARYSFRSGQALRGEGR